MAGQKDFAVKPRLWRVVAFWALFQVALVPAALQGGSSLGESLLFLGLGTAVLLVVFTLGGWAYYRSLCALRERGVIVEAKVIPGRGETIFWVKYAYEGTEYEPRVGMVVDFDSSVRQALERAVKEKRPVRLLVDPRKPSRYFILPLETRPARGALEAAGPGRDAGVGPGEPGASAGRPGD
jgi:hypothetical protein